MMNKNALRTGDMVVMNNGKKATFMMVGNTPIFKYHTDNASFTYVSKYSDNLSHPRNAHYTVDEVYRVSAGVDEKRRNDAIFNPNKMAEYGEAISLRRNGGTTPRAEVVTGTIGKDTIQSLDDTQTGDMIEFANGKFATVFRDMPHSADCVRFHTESNSFMPFTRFNGLDHFKRDGYNIVKIYRVDTSGLNLPTNKIYDVICNPQKMQEFGDVIYDRASAYDNDFITDVNVAIDEVDSGDTANESVCNCNKNDILTALGSTLEIINRLLSDMQ